MSRPLADLFQTRVQEASLSPASIQASRCIALGFGKLVYASGPSIYLTTFDTEPICKHLEHPQKEGKKTGLVSATHVLPHASSVELTSFRFESEIQSIIAKKTAEGWLIGGVDCLGQGIVGLFSDLESSASAKCMYSLKAPRVLEDGWCGIDLFLPGALDASNIAYVCLASALGKSISLYILSSNVETPSVESEPIVTWNSILPVTGLTMTQVAKPGKKQEAGIVAIAAETRLISIYDVLSVVQHYASSPIEPLPSHLLYSSQTERPGGSLEDYGNVKTHKDTIAVMGAQGSVWLYSINGWKTRGTWFAPAKYDLTGLVLDDVNKRIYVSGADQEILGGVYAGGAGDAAGGGATRRKGAGGGEGRRPHAPGFTGGRNPDAVPGRGDKVEKEAGEKRSREDTVETPSPSPTPVPAQSSNVADSHLLEDTPVPVPDAVLETAVTAPIGTTAGADESSGPSRFRYTGFRGDSRWVGLSVLLACEASEGDSIGQKQSELGDILYALSEQGWLYVVTNAEKMAVTLGK